MHNKVHLTYSAVVLCHVIFSIVEYYNGPIILCGYVKNNHALKSVLEEWKKILNNLHKDLVDEELSWADVCRLGSGVTTGVTGHCCIIYIAWLLFDIFWWPSHACKIRPDGKHHGFTSGWCVGADAAVIYDIRSMSIWLGLLSLSDHRDLEHIGAPC